MCPIILINRADRPQRLLDSLSELRGVNMVSNVVRMEACLPEEAKRLRFEHLDYQSYDNITNNQGETLVIPTWGALACGISHRRCWEYISNGSFEEGLVVEDDIVFRDDRFGFYINAAKKVLKKNPNTPLCIFFGASNHTGFDYYTNDIHGGLAMDDPLPDGSRERVNGLITGCHCYLVNLRGARYLLEEIVQFRYQVDIEISMLTTSPPNTRNGMFDFKCLNYPNCGVEQKKNLDSDVQIISYNRIGKFLPHVPSNVLGLIRSYLPKYNLYDYVSRLDPFEVLINV